MATAVVKTLFIELGGPWENGYNESCNGELRNERLSGEFFYTLVEVPTDRWRRHYNTVWPGSALGCRPPAPQAILPSMAKSPFPETVRTLSVQMDQS